MTTSGDVQTVKIKWRHLTDNINDYDCSASKPLGLELSSGFSLEGVFQPSHPQVVVGDWNADGYDDLAIFNPLGTNRGLFLLNDKTNVFELQNINVPFGPAFENVDFSETNVVAGNFAGGDNYADLLFINTRTGSVASLNNNQAFAFDNMNGDTSLSWMLIAENRVAGKQKVLSNDFNDDGIDDLLFHFPGQHYFRVLYGAEDKNHDFTYLTDSTGSVEQASLGWSGGDPSYPFFIVNFDFSNSLK